MTVARARLLELQELDRITDIPPAEWNAVRPDELQSSHDFVRTCEEAPPPGTTLKHLVLRDERGVAGVASLCAMPVSLDLLSTGLTRRAIRAVRRWRPGFLSLPVVFCGPPVSFGRSSFALRDDVDAAKALALVHDAAERLAREVDAPLVCFKEFGPAEEQRLAPLERLGYFRAASLPSCRLALRWNSFDAYLGAMRSGYRRQVRASLAATARAGVRVRLVEDWSDQCARLHPLYGQVMDRAEFQLERLTASFFERLATNLAGKSPAILMEKDGALIAAAILLRAAGEATFLLAGIDYAAHRDSHAYLTLVAEVVRWAIASGAPALEMGQTSYDLKGRLGAAPAPRALFLRARRATLHAALRAARGLLFPAPAIRQRRVFRGD